MRTRVLVGLRLGEVEEGHPEGAREQDRGEAPGRLDGDAERRGREETTLAVAQELQQTRRISQAWSAWHCSDRHQAWLSVSARRGQPGTGRPGSAESRLLMDRVAGQGEGMQSKQHSASPDSSGRMPMPCACAHAVRAIQGFHVFLPTCPVRILARRRILARAFQAGHSVSTPSIFKIEK